MQLFGEEVYAEIAVLTSLRRGGDADHLARTALQDQQIADADMVRRDGDRVGRSVTFATVRHGGFASRCRNSDLSVLHHDVLSVVMMLAVAIRAVDWMQDSVGSLFDTSTERMVVALVVVVSHINPVLVLWLLEGPSLSDCDLLVDV